MTSKRSGFTLTELIFSVFILVVTLAGAMLLFISYRNAWVVATLARNTSTEASFAMERIVYGTGTNSGLRAAQLATVNLSHPGGGWRIDYDDSRFIRYNPGAETITDENSEVLCESVLDSTCSLTNNGCAFTITVEEDGGGHSATNMLSSYVHFRN